MHGDSDEVVPGISQGTHVAELARDCIRSDQWVASDDAGIPGRLALWATESSFVETFVIAELAASGGQSISYSAVHVDLENPITDLISLRLGKQVLLWQRDLIGHWDVGAFEVGVLLDHVAIRVLDGIPQIDVAIEEDECHVILVDLTVGITSIQEGFVGSDVLAISEKGGAESGIYIVEVVLSALALEQEKMSDHEVFMELDVDWAVLVSND